jgi:hypothetical protein
MNLCPGPHVTVFEVLEDVDLPGSFWGIEIPTAPVTIIIEIILPGAGLEDSIPRYGPGKFVFEGCHFCTLMLQINTRKRIQIRAPIEIGFDHPEVFLLFAKIYDFT